MDERVNLALSFNINSNLYFLDLNFGIGTIKYILKPTFWRKSTNPFISLGMGNYFAFAILCRKKNGSVLSAFTGKLKTMIKLRIPKNLSMWKTKLQIITHFMWPD